ACVEGLYPLEDLLTILGVLDGKYKLGEKISQPVHENERDDHVQKKDDDTDDRVEWDLKPPNHPVPHGSCDENHPIGRFEDGANKGTDVAHHVVLILNQKRGFRQSNW